MKKKPKLYSKLPGITYRNLGRYTLWKGADHLLLMFSNGMSEDYKRYYYKDILGMVITKTRKAAITAWVILGLFLLTGWYTWEFGTNGNPVASGFIGSMAFVFLSYLLMLLIRGPSCECRIITAVQNEKLPAVTLLRQGKKLMKVLKPIILEAQGTMDNDHIGAALDLLSEVKRNTEQPVTPKTASINQEPDINITYLKSFYFSLLLSLILYGVMVALSLNQRTKLLVSLAYIFLFIAGLSSACSLAVMAKKKVFPSIRKLAWAGFSFVIVAFLMSYGEMLVLLFLKAFHNPESTDALSAQTDMFTGYYSVRPLDYRLVTSMDGLKIVFSVFMGISGLFLMKTLRNR